MKKIILLIGLSLLVSNSFSYAATPLPQAQQEFLKILLRTTLIKNLQLFCKQDLNLLIHVSIVLAVFIRI